MKGRGAAGTHASARAEEPETHTEVIEAEGSWGLLRPRSQKDLKRIRTLQVGHQVPSWPPASQSFFRPDNLSQPHQLALQSYLQNFRSLYWPGLPATPAQIAGPRLHQDPYKIGLSHHAKFFSFNAKMSMEKKALKMVEKCLDKYFQHLCDDLEVFAAHVGRKTVKSRTWTC